MRKTVKDWKSKRMDEIGTVFSADCAEMNELGSGIVRHGNLVVFVPGLVPGDRAELRIESIEKNYAIGKCIFLIRRSPHRTDPRCPDAERCGGCTLGHVSYALENEIKRNTVRSAFRRNGLKDIEPEPTLFGQDRYGYRNKMSLRFDPRTNRFGYCREGSEDVLPFSACPLCPAAFSAVVRFLNDHPGLTAPLSPSSLRIREDADGIVVSLTASVSDPDSMENCSRSLKEAVPEVRAVLADPGTGEKTRSAVDGSEEIREKIAGLDLRFSVEAFRQVNTPVFGMLLDTLLSFASECPFRRAADLYCGSGMIGLALAKAFPDARITGIEINPEAVQDAKKNAARNGLGNIRFFAGDAATYRSRIGKNDAPELVTVDPPRAGLSRQMRKELLTLAPERVIYVSCNPQTLARDARELTENGYEVKRVVPVNLFPATKHVETVCCLYHRKKDFITVPYESKNAEYQKQMKENISSLRGNGADKNSKEARI
ncbi:MAG: 23S rRNA (uracil(1939)-C(5))-methyltransferase RlmD [Ruminococcaceae bacterium]|nr:23S rRNA (uracil(1939)-C(5))-methyltransferase RlmD [Oscillospiraceae bacterium]